MVTGHKQRAAEDDFGCSPLKAFQAVHLCSAQVTPCRAGVLQDRPDVG